MPTGWICRSRTDSVIPEEPPIVLQYDLVSGDIVLKDVARFLAAAPIGTMVRVVTDLDDVRETLRKWTSANGVIIAREDEARVLAVGGCLRNLYWNYAARNDARKPSVARDDDLFRSV
jgi:hypothetical protein